jgi:diguanylate cyclase (GGDEF)-like protein
MFDHQVQFYDSDAFLVDAVRAFVAPSMQDSGGAIVIATREHLALLKATFGAVEGGGQRDERDHFVLLDASETLDTFMVDGLPDEQRFMDVVGGLVRQLSDHGRRRLSAFGEMVAVLYAQGKPEAAIQLERLWEKLAAQHRFRLLCAYPSSAFPDAGHSAAFECICAAHSHVNPIERLHGEGAGPQALHRTIALLQQRADALESELRKRVDWESVLSSQNARITAMTSAQAELENLAGQDALTGLANRRIFTDRLAHAVERAARTGNPLSLIYVDLDAFKALNDRHGHGAGDELLKQVSARLRQSVRAADTVCRWGGDEFAVIMEDTDAAQATALMQRVESALGETFFLGDAPIAVSASVGLSSCPADAIDSEGLVRRADAAMYRAKRSGKSCRVKGQATAAPPVTSPGPGRQLREVAGSDGVPRFLTVEAAAGRLRLSRPHVLKLIAERCFHDVVWQHGGVPLIPECEVGRVAQDISG